MIKKLKYIKFQDIIDVFIFIFLFPISFLLKLYFKLNSREVWLITEDGYSASDNGYHLFKYIRKKYHNQEVYYVIDRQSKELSKISKYNNIIYYRTIKHWLYYLACEKIITTDKVSAPSLAVFYLLESYGIIKNKRVFLQHGITMNNVPPLHYGKSKISLFICGAKPEFEYISNNFGYPKRKSLIHRICKI